MIRNSDSLIIWFHFLLNKNIAFTKVIMSFNTKQLSININIMYAAQNRKCNYEVEFHNLLIMRSPKILELCLGSSSATHVMRLRSTPSNTVGYLAGKTSYSWIINEAISLGPQGILAEIWPIKLQLTSTGLVYILMSFTLLLIIA